ncbi:hypothetical protein LCI18_000403 [Fusarium solani-melongenae]|uniref:Uncharacterized protein n=1 Tax=Fusarium solani subsp. cucurbitae TaxID=2747967 RepID=A0ACD3YKR5_FUSSC|nr:hypothetical protein LCI18_000403 [Fusarium solani-melongenae]
MRQPSREKNDAIEARRERNRRAQQVFRQRRQANKEAQRCRIQQLENTVEELSNVIINFCDEMIGTEEIAREKRLMARLQRCTAEALALARSASSTNASPTARETEDDEQKIEEYKYSTKKANQKITDSALPQASSCHHPDSADTIPPPLIDQTWPQTHQHGPDTSSSFPLHLVETTISQAFLYLNGDVYITVEDLERAFGFSLRLHTRQQLLHHLQWMLGPGKDAMHQATGINWSTTAWSGGGGGSTDLSWSFAEDSSPSTDDGSEGDIQPEFLTALGVQQQLESLGAKVLGSDLIELNISGYESLQLRSTADSSPASLSAARPAHAPSSVESAALIVWLNTSLLTSNLANVAMCLDKGPVYPRRGVARAVEASVIMAQGGEAADMGTIYNGWVPKPRGSGPFPT